MMEITHIFSYQIDVRIFAKLGVFQSGWKCKRSVGLELLEAALEEWRIKARWHNH